MPATTRRPTRPVSRNPRASPPRSCATTAISTRPRPAPRSASQPSTTYRTSRTRRWSRRPRPLASPTASVRSGDVSSRPRPRAIWWPSGSAPTIISTFNVEAKHEAPLELGMGVINVPFAIPNIRIENPEAIAHTRIGWFRSVSNIPHAFAVQSFVAELAAAAGRDPKDFLLEVIGPARQVSPDTLSDMWNHGESPERYPGDTGRLRRVVETVARESGWGKKLPKGRGLGIAAHYSFVSYIAAVVEVAVDDKGVVTIPRVDMAIDCGATVNPDRVRSQMEGACVMGVGL